MKFSFWSLTIIDRYLIRELYKTFLGVTLVLLMIISANNFVMMLEEIVKGYFKSDLLWLLIGLELLRTIGYLMPPAFFFAILISLGRLYRDSEIIALQASGVGPFSIYRSYLIGAIPVAILASLLVMFSLPWANHAMGQLQTNKQDENIEIGLVETGKFLELQNGETIFFSESRGAKEGEIRDIFIQKQNQGKLSIIIAEQAYQQVEKQTGDLYLVLKNGHRYTGEPGQKNYTTTQFYEYGMHIRKKEQLKKSIPVNAMPTVSLLGSPLLLHRLEMQFRLSVPLAILALTFLAVPLSRSLPRQGIWARLVLAFIVYFCFMNLHKLAKDWMEFEITPSWLGMWWLPLAAVLTAMLIELYDQHGYLLNWKILTRMKRT